MQTVVLNADYTYLNTVPWQRAIKLLVKEKAEVLKESNQQVRTYEDTYKFKIPLVLKLVKLVKTVYRNKVSYSRKNVFIRDNNTCQYCGAHDNLSIDHIMPSSKGGKSCFKNCVVCCVKCNHCKGDKALTSTCMRLKRTPYEPTIVEFLMYKMKHAGVYSFLKEIKIY